MAPDVPKLTAAQKEAIDMLMATAQELCFEMTLEPGDLQLINSHVTYHGRTPFEDDAASRPRPAAAAAVAVHAQQPAAARGPRGAVAQHRGRPAARRHPAGGDLIKTVGAILARAAAQEILPRFQALTAGQVRQKTSAFDIVTEADEAAEAVIAAGLRDAFPGALIVGEEGTERDPSLLQAIGGADWPSCRPDRRHEELRVRPAAVRRDGGGDRRGEIVAGVIHDPICRDFAYAVRDGGAWLEREDGNEPRCASRRRCRSTGWKASSARPSCPEPLRDTVNGNLSSSRPAPGSAAPRTILVGRCRPLPPAVLQQADALGSCGGLAAASRGRRLQRAFRRHALSADRPQRWPDLRARRSELARRPGALLGA